MIPDITHFSTITSHENDIQYNSSYGESDGKKINSIVASTLKKNHNI